MKLLKFSGFLDFVDINDSNLLPKVHLFMFGNHFFDIPFDKEILVNKGHITDDLPHINRRGQSNQSLNGFAVVILTQVPHQVVPPEAGPHHIDRRVRVVVLDSVQGGLELAMLAGGKGYRAGHLVVDPTAVQAD